MEVATASGDSSGGENISRPGLRTGEPSGIGSNARVYKFQAADQSVNACVVSPRAFGGAAALSVFQLWVWKGAALAALTKACPYSVASVRW